MSGLIIRARSHERESSAINRRRVSGFHARYTSALSSYITALTRNRDFFLDARYERKDDPTPTHAQKERNSRCHVRISRQAI